MNAQKELDEAIERILELTPQPYRTIISLWLKVVVSTAKLVQVESDLAKVKS
jgi:hypothetical protein